MIRQSVRHRRRVALAVLAQGAAATEFRSADTHNADDYPTVVAVKKMSELLEKKSGGKHKIKVFNKQALGSEKETIDQVKIGALDFTRVNVGPMNAICPLTQVPTMPFLFNSIAHMRKVLDGPVGDEILKSCESAGFIGLAFYDSGARSIYAKKPIKTVADAKGLKIRVQQSDLWVALVSAMGANATPMPYGEVYTALKTGLIDAAENNIPSFDTAKHVEAVKIYSKTEHSMAPEILVMSKIDLRQAAQGRAGHDPRRGQGVGGVPAPEVGRAGSQVARQREGAGRRDRRGRQEVVPGRDGPVYDKFMTTPDMKRLVKAAPGHEVAAAGGPCTPASVPGCPSSA